jgi:predicted membrane protein
MSTARPASNTAPATGRGLRWPSLTVGLGLMVVISIYPPLLTDASGQADHSLAMVLMWAMSAGLVSGVGFVPRWWGWRWLFSGVATGLALVLALAYRFHGLF